MLELFLLLLTLAILAVLLRPLVRNRPLPDWLARARARGRPGVPVTAWLVAFLVMTLARLIGEQRGILALLLWLLWVGAPLAAGAISFLWLRRAQDTEHGAQG